MSDNLIPDVYRSDHLFLLIGTNPLPNYVVARLLAQRNATVYLLHSDGAEGSPSTKGIAEQLEISLCKKRPDVTVVLRGISDSDSLKIEDTVERIMQHIYDKNSQASVGLNYTGGTKPMAIHSYRVLERKFPHTVFSYLDPRKLALRIDGRGAQGLQLFYLVKEDGLLRAVGMSLSELASLHGYTLPETRKTPEHPDLYRALVEVHSNKQSFHEWRGRYDKKSKSKGWLRTRPLEKLPTRDAYPHLDPIIEAFDTLCGGKGCGTPELIARLFGFDSLDSCHKWFNGGWLEEYTLKAVKTAAIANGKIHSYGINLKPKPPANRPDDANFELDVAVMLGYQLFAISCIATEHANAETKKHLFEVFVRARQLGGDEARIGLVCCVEDPTKLRDQVAREWDAKGKIWVFGRSALHDLESEIKLWFETANP